RHSTRPTPLPLSVRFTSTSMRSCADVLASRGRRIVTSGAGPLPVATSHNLRTSSQLPAITVRPSGENAAVVLSFVSKALASLPVVKSQNLRPLWSTLSAVRRSEETATDPTGYDDP